MLAGPMGLGRLSIDAAKADDAPINSKKMMNIAVTMLEKEIFIKVK